MAYLYPWVVYVITNELMLRIFTNQNFMEIYLFDKSIDGGNYWVFIENY